MLVFTVKLDEKTSIFDKNGNLLGKIQIVNIDKREHVKIGLEFSDEVVIARPGVDFEKALSICNSRSK